MKRGDIIRYVDMTMQEGMGLQQGMNFSIQRGYHIILMSVRANAPYADQLLNNGNTILYEGHNIRKNNTLNKDVSRLDQPMFSSCGTLTQNGKFYEAAQRYKLRQEHPDKVRVYEKIKPGIWVYNGFFELVDANIIVENRRKVFKFTLNMLDSDEEDGEIFNVNHLAIEHNRLIPTLIKQQVFARDKGKCVSCGSNLNLHYDHIIPFSRGGSSVDANNIQILCQTCNLKKKANIE